MIRKILAGKFFLLLLLFVFLIAGCGYTTSSLLPSHIRTIHVLPFKNKIDYASESSRNLYLPLLEVNVRNAVVDRFLFDGHLKIASENQADVILKGEVLDYERSGLRFNRDDERETEEFRIQIFVSLSLWDVRKQEEIWSESNFAGEATFFTTGPQARSESAALEEALEDLARRVVERTIENW